MKRICEELQEGLKEVEINWELYTVEENIIIKVEDSKLAIMHEDDKRLKLVYLPDIEATDLELIQCGIEPISLIYDEAIEIELFIKDVENMLYFAKSAMNMMSAIESIKN